MTAPGRHTRDEAGARSAGSFLPARGSLAGALVLVTMVFLAAHHHDPARPLVMARPDGFWGWQDQGRYLQAAIAWVHGDMLPAHHWYLPGYSLLAALFVPLGWPDPFLIPDLACLLLSVALCGGIASALTEGRPWAFPFGVAIFTALVVFSPLYRQSWATPWTTTPTTPLVLGCMLLVMRFQQTPTARLAFQTGVVMTIVAWFRPTEAIILLVTVPFFMVASLAWSGLRVRRIATVAACGLSGAMIPLLALLVLLVLIGGFSPMSYMANSARIGFEWRMVPLRWVTIVISPMPLFTSGEGLAKIFRWVIPGCCGLIVACCGRLGGARQCHLFAGSTVAATMALYLAYRDLHPQGLWMFGNYHYFKTVLPLLAIYAGLLVVELATSKRRGSVALIAAMSAVLLFSWRAEWRPASAGSPSIVTGPHTLSIPDGLDMPADALLVTARGGFDAIYSGRTDLRVGANDYHMNGDYKSVVVPGGMLVEPLRPVGRGAKVLTVDSAVALSASPPPVIGRMVAVFGSPCWRRDARSCGKAAEQAGAPAK